MELRAWARVWGATYEEARAAGFRYLIEKQLPPNLWSPFLIVTNVTGSVTFTDPAQTRGSMGLYRARILD